MKKTPNEIYILNGPNLNMMGLVEPEVYGTETLLDLEKRVTEAAKELPEKVKLHFFQTNFEGELLEFIHALVLDAGKKSKLIGIVINPAGWTHTSVAMRDALLMLRPVPLVEVHLSNLAEREQFRQYSVLQDIVDYRVMGLGVDGYVEALRFLVAETQKERLDVH